MRTDSSVKRSALLVMVLAILATLSPVFSKLVWAQGAGEYRAEAIVLVNSASDSYQDFERYIQPFLDQFGVSYTRLDIAAAPVSGGISDYALIIVGHRRLDPNHLYLDSTEQTAISTAVAHGSGLVNFDGDLADGLLTARYQFIQEIFQFGYQGSTAGRDVDIHSEVGLTGAYIVASHPNNISYRLDGDIGVQGVVAAGNTSTLASLAGEPLVIAAPHGSGRAVQWATYEWLDDQIWGYVRGFDDLVWRSLVWASRKPFVMQGMPPLVAMRVDDCSGPFWWAEDAAVLGLKPWLGFFLHDIDPDETAQMRALIDSGDATASIHAFSQNNFFYYNHNSGDYSNAEIAANFAEGTQWHQDNSIPISKFVLGHYYDMGTNAFDGLNDWGVEFFGTVQEIGTEYGTEWMMIGPYRKHTLGGSAEILPMFYADFVEVPGHPEYDNRFFNVVTEIRDNAGYEWFPSNNVAVSIDRGVTQLRRAFDSMVLATLFTHEYEIWGISRANWNAILVGVADGVAAYNPQYVTMDYASQYARAMYTSGIASSVYDPVFRTLDTTLTGSSDLPTYFYLFVEEGGVIQHTLIDVPSFSGSVAVATLAEMPTPTPSPTPTLTPTPGPPTPTPTPTLTPTIGPPTPVPTPTPTPTSTPLPPAGLVFWDDLDPVKETWTHYAGQGVDDWALSTASSHSPNHAFFSSDVSSVKDDYLLTGTFIVPFDGMLSFWHTYELERFGDGAIIEISVDGGTTFVDLGPRIVTGPYTDLIATGWNSAISGRMAWTGGSVGAMTEVIADLSVYAGQSAILRFRLACDSGEGSHGWYVDDIRVSSSGLSPTPTHTPTPEPPTPIATETPTSPPTATPEPPTPIATETPTSPPTPTPEPPTPIATETPTSPPTPTPEPPTPIATETPTSPPTPTPEPPTPIATETPTSPPTPTPEPPTPIATETPTSPPTPTPGPPTPIATETPTSPPTPTPAVGLVFWDDFDPIKEIWTHHAGQGVDDWALSTASSHSPNHAFFSSDVSSVKDDYLLTGPFNVPIDGMLSFWHSYELERFGDGAVIEISLDGGATFSDLGTRIVTGPYTDLIATGWNSPISGRMAWTGGSLGAMTEVIADLSAYAGQSAILRFRLTCDSGAGSHGWYVDDVRVSGSGLLPTPTPSPTPGGPTATPTPILPTPTPTSTPISYRFDVWQDGHQEPVLATTTAVGDLVPGDDQWTEFLYQERGFPGIFAASGESPPLMRFFGTVPDGTYDVLAGLYWASDLRYYWGRSAGNPEEFSFDVTAGNPGDFAAYTIGTMTVSGGTFELFVRRADQLPGGDYPFWGWAWIELVSVAP